MPFTSTRRWFAESRSMKTGGQFDAIAVTDFVKNKVDTRFINNVSGEQDLGVGDFYDCHIYM
ncbi:hypothetical protein RJ45_09420 [Photobacterium gaetbulicola]|uniref:Uncharacterized protein n=1 Tax=Photobacterium gaetbulicola TaxID=1295392 RepID=A0A0B9G5L3_9GAMM|nr:hypothetical protein RJ45_09420 [Photobacterium gaetbulicola]